MVWLPPDASRDPAMTERSLRSPQVTISQARRYVINTPADLVVLRECALEGASEAAPTAIIAALTEFAGRLYQLPPVAGAAFLTSRQRRREPHGPTSLTIEIMQPLAPENAAGADAFQAVALAKDQLCEQLLAALPCTLGVVNTESTPLAELEPALWRRWRDDPSLTLRAFLIFQRA